MQDETALKTVFIGVDVAQADLSVATSPPSTQRRLRNERAALTKWLHTLAPGSAIAMESTGRYHQLLALLAVQAGMQVYVLNARDVYFYAKALGVRGKTDASDAQVIARYLAEHHQRLHPWMAGTAAQQQLLQLLRRRATIARHFGAIDDSLEGVSELSGQRLSLAHYAHELLVGIDQQIQTLIDSDAQMQQRQQRLQSIPGIGPQISALLTALLSRIAFANVQALVAYSGLDPRPKDSGTQRGRRRLTKRGPPELRRLLWLGAFSASHSKAFGPIYQAIKRRGFSGTEALVILARKLLRVAWAVWRTGEPFDPARLPCSA